MLFCDCDSDDRDDIDDGYDRDDRDDSDDSDDRDDRDDSDRWHVKVTGESNRKHWQLRVFSLIGLIISDYIQKYLKHFG